MLCHYYKQYLVKYNVTLPKLYINEKYTRDSLVLIYLMQGYPKTKPVSKSELTSFIKEYFPNTNDVQQARNLGAQKGWFILSGTRKDIHSLDTIIPGEYLLVSLEKPYPDFTNERRKNETMLDEWDNLKMQYGNRCATCGSEEGKVNFRWRNTITKLQKGHIDPTKPLKTGNIIPQCEKCNRADRNNWIYDKKGRVISIANAAIIDRCDIKIKKEMYLRLKKEFDGGQ